MHSSPVSFIAEPKGPAVQHSHFGRYRRDFNAIANHLGVVRALSARPRQFFRRGTARGAFTLESLVEHSFVFEQVVGCGFEFLQSYWMQQSLLIASS